MDKNRVLEIVKAEVDTISDMMMLDATVDYSTEEGEDGFLIVNVVFSGEDLGYMIGNRGLHLQAFQYILSNIVKSKVRKETGEEEIKLAVLVDVGGYKAARNEKIERLAMQKADDARILGEPVDLLPMSAGDRRVVHSVLGKFDDLKTESFGEGRDRFVRITPLKEEEIGVQLEADEQASAEE